MADHAQEILSLKNHAHFLAKELEALKKRLESAESDIGTLRTELIELKQR